MIEADISNYYERFAELKNYVGWTEKDQALVTACKPLVEPRFEPMIDDFYSTIQGTPNAMQVITGGDEQIQRLKQTLVIWVDQLFEGPYDENYVLRRLKVGTRHVEIGLDQVYTNVAMSRLRNQITTAIMENWTGERGELTTAVNAVNKLIDLDLAVIEDAYQIAFTSARRKEERYATIGKISGGIAHEVRNPLNVIKTSIYFLQNAKESTPKEKLEKHLARVAQAVDDANKIVSALSQFARLPSPALSPVSIHEIVSDAVEKNSLSVPVKVSIDCTLNDDQVLGESAQLLIAFGNLIRNALQAVGSDGEVTIKLCEINGKKSVVVRDNGNGISAEDLARITDPLFSTKTKGLGLGLAITKAILDSHQAELVVDSEVGEGTEFKVLFPFREPVSA